MTSDPGEGLEARIEALQSRLLKSRSDLSVDTRLRVEHIGADVTGFLVVREQLRGFIPDTELSSTSLALLEQSYQVGEGHLEDHGNAIASALDGIANSLKDLAEALEGARK